MLGLTDSSYESIAPQPIHRPFGLAIFFVKWDSVYGQNLWKKYKSKVVKKKICEKIDHNTLSLLTKKFAGPKSHLVGCGEVESKTI